MPDCEMIARDVRAGVADHTDRNICRTELFTLNHSNVAFKSAECVAVRSADIAKLAKGCFRNQTRSADGCNMGRGSLFAGQVNEGQIYASRAQKLPFRTVNIADMATGLSAFASWPLSGRQKHTMNGGVGAKLWILFTSHPQFGKA